MPAWLRRHDPGLLATRRAARVTIAACVAFYVLRYGFSSRVMAVYAIFGVIALGGLSEIAGRPPQRTRTMLGCLVVGELLVILGTLLAARTWAAAVGMLVTGFLVAYVGASGPRTSGVINGMLLLYILPSFPPYAPDTLPQRLLGLAAGVGLLALADRLLWPPPAPRRFADRLASVVQRIADQAEVLADHLVGIGDDSRPAALAEATRLAYAAIDDVRLSRLPPSERPTGPNVRDRALTHAAAVLRLLPSRLEAVCDTLANSDIGQPRDGTEQTVAAVASGLRTIQRGLAGTGPAPAVQPIEHAIAEQAATRLRRLADPAPIDQFDARTELHVAAAEAADTTRILMLATRAALGAPEPASAAEDTAGSGPLWYVRASRAELWWRRLRSNATVRSVYFQNAARLALGLAAARVVAGELDLSHGFWVLLATLTLMRPSVSATRTALLPALAGTLVGALITAGLLYLTGPDHVLYVILLPLLLGFTLAAGPMLGLAVGQAGFTMAVAVLFGQVAPIEWRLAETRLLDVTLGGLVGVLVGVAVWPRGGGAEIIRAGSTCLRAGADYIEETATRLAAGTLGRDQVSAAAAPATHSLLMFDATYAQYRSERSAARTERVDWLTLLAVAHLLVRGTEWLAHRHRAADAPPWSWARDELQALVRDVAQGYRAVAARLAADPASPPADEPAGVTEAADLRARMRALLAAVERAPDRVAYASSALQIADIDGWLSWLSGDLSSLGPVAASPRLLSAGSPAHGRTAS